MHLLHDREQLAHRVASLIEHQTTEAAPAVAHLRGDRYTDPARFDAEIRAIFGHGYWVGSSARIAEKEVYARLRSLDGDRLATRDEFGNCHLHVNACAHRGAQLTADDCGAARRLTCPYHGWSYHADGRLAGRPDGEYFENDDAASTRLRSQPLVECSGLLGVAGAQGDANLTIDAALDEELRASGVDRMVAERFSYDEHPANWKVPIDTFLENYHTRVLHRHSIAGLFITNIAAFDAFGNSCRVILPKRDFIEGAVDGGRPIVEYATVLYFVYPNTMIALLPGHAAVWNIVPLTAGTIGLQHAILTEPRENVSEAAQDMWAASLSVIDSVVSEDISGALGVQAGLTHAGADFELHIGRCEPALQFVHAVFDRQLGA